MNSSKRQVIQIVFACAVGWLVASAASANSPAIKEPPPVERAEVAKPDASGIAYVAHDPNALVTFNLEDADLMELVRTMSQITGRRFIIATKPRNIKATVYAPTKVRVADAYEAFLSILALNGMTVVPAGPYNKIVETAKIESQPVPLSIGPR